MPQRYRRTTPAAAASGRSQPRKALASLAYVNRLLIIGLSTSNPSGSFLSLNDYAGLALISSQAKATILKIKNIALKRMTSGSSEFRLNKANVKILKKLLKRLDNLVECQKWYEHTRIRILDTIGVLRNYLDIFLSELKGPGKQKRSSTMANLELASPEPPKKYAKIVDTKFTTNPGVIGGTTITVKKPSSSTTSTVGSNMMKSSDLQIDIPSLSQQKEDSQSSWPNSLLSPRINQLLNGTAEYGTMISPSELYCDELIPTSTGALSPEI